MKALLLATAFALASIAPAQAATINGSTTGIASPATTITFSELGLPSNTLVTNQYAGLGVSFSGGAYQTPQTGGFPNIVGDNIGNFSTGSGFSPITLTFSAVQSDAAFAMVSNTTSYTFAALLGNAVVESFTATVSATSPNNFYGFTGISFDGIRITSNQTGGSDSFLLDNLQLGNASNVVPEPTTWALMLLGFGGMGYAMRRRPKVGTRIRFA